MSPVVCLCAGPTVDSLGTCRSCGRKPVSLLGVIGSRAVAAHGFAVTDRPLLRLVDPPSD